MKAKHKIICVSVAVVLAALFTYDMLNKDVYALERVSDRTGRYVKCKIEEINGKRWGACRFKENNAPASAWLERDGLWVAANGDAREVVSELANVSDLKKLPDVSIDFENSPNMPTSLFEQ
ncbi:hypothetical protein Q6A51_13240 [Pseudomonas sp. KFB-139]|uniref:DUF333 domain-containing protein n=1 Tax=Pseudomonas serbiensis TaxID=3064350 RepID=A0ABT9CRH8_9PSED|nr:hypothetical protein [Pseudomonas sp. KFB-138]MDO7927754.1 hypothetical protein [Pseudomonas sp. KFB-138]